MSDPIAILEAAYELVGDEQQWLRQLTESLKSTLGSGNGVHARTFDASMSNALTFRAMVNGGVDERVMASLFQVEFPVALHETVVRMFRTGSVGTLRSVVAYLPGQSTYYDHALQSLGLTDVFCMNAVDPTYLGCFIVAPSTSRGGMQPLEIQRWRRVAAHVATAFRVRRQFAVAPAAAPDTAAFAPEAVLRPDGKIEHAEGPAQTTVARAALRRAARAVDRARGPLRRYDPEEAIAIWEALVAGRWSLVDHHDSDGRRFLLAHRNDASVPDSRGLTLRERQVVAYASLGHSNKVIAYELGLSTSTIAGHLARARAKLQLPSGAALASRGAASSDSE